MSEKQPLRKRRWALTVFESATCYDSVLEILLKAKNLDYAVILHDKDIDEQGKAKKPHYHIILDYTNPHYFSSLSSEFEGAHIEPVSKFEQAVQYLIHKNSPDKYQYKVEEVKTNNEEWLNGAINADTIISKRFDFNKIPQYYGDFKSSDVAVGFVPYLLAMFPNDAYSIIQKAKAIDVYIVYLEQVEEASTEQTKKEIF